MARSKFNLPKYHEPAMAVPHGGSMCANCHFYDSSGGPYGQCHEPNYAAFYLTKLIPCPPDAFCSDWYVPAQAVVCG